MSLACFCVSTPYSSTLLALSRRPQISNNLDGINTSPRTMYIPTKYSKVSTSATKSNFRYLRASSRIAAQHNNQDHCHHPRASGIDNASDTTLIQYIAFSRTE